MIELVELIYEWDEEEYTWLLFKLEEGKKIFEKEFEDREDLLIYIEQHYTLANLIVRGN